MALPGIILRGMIAKRLARTAFQGSTVGRMVGAARGGGPLGKLQALQGQLEGLASQTVHMAGGPAAATVARYASKEAARETALGAFWETLGPLGDVLKGAFGKVKGIKPPGPPKGRLEDELRAAAAFLRAHGIENVSEILGPGTEGQRRAVGVGERLGGGAIGPADLSGAERAALQSARLMLREGANPAAVAGAISTLGLSQAKILEILQRAGLTPTQATEAVAAAPRPGFRRLAEEVPAAIKIEKVQSTNVYSVGYDKEASTLFITYRAGAGGGQGPTYEYFGVPQRVYNTIKNAAPFSQESVGVKVWELIRKPGRRVEPAKAAAQARGRRWIRDGSGDRITHQYAWDIAEVGPSGYMPRAIVAGGYQQRKRRAGARGIIKSPLPGTVGGIEGARTLTLGGVRGARRVAAIKRV